MQKPVANVAKLIIAGQRVMQPFRVRPFMRVSLPRSAEPVDIPRTSHSNAPSYLPAPRPPRKKGSTSKPKVKRQYLAARQKEKSAPGYSKHQRKANVGFSARAQRDQMLGHGGFVQDNWCTDWGKDELAPPSASTERTKRSELRPRKKAVPVTSSPSSFTYVRRTEGYIPDMADQRNNVLRDVESPSEHKPIAQLAHGLDRVLFNPGVSWLRDPRSRIYNFTPWLESIPAVTDFAFERVTGFVKSSMDNDLWRIAKQHKRSFAGSTSSLTGLLSHCYFLISGDKDVDTSSLSHAFLHQPANFTPGQRMPTSVVLNYREGIWLIDSDKTEELAEKNILTWMGTMLEKFLTVPEGEFKKLLRSTPALEDDTRREAYRYAMSDRFVMRSQLDCVDPRLPGTGIFDIKTRAAVPIRMDILNYEENSGYLIKRLTGPLESFEKEYYDLIRSAFLKYSFQARIGNMDGILVAYHNTARIFGFQYVSLEEMEERLYGTGDGAKVFDKCILLLERVLSDVVSIYGGQSVKCTFETRESSQELNVWVQPVEWNEEVERKPCPITELDVRVVNYLDGGKVSGANAVADSRKWGVHWTLSESALGENEIRRRLESSRGRQFRALNFPAGIKTIEEMEKMWSKIDFGGKRTAQEVIAVMKELESRAEDVSLESRTEPDRETLSQVQGGSGTATQERDELSRLQSESHSMPPRPSSTFPFLSFREPDESIRQLRRLALQGREETSREEAEGREKVVWSSVDGWRDGQVEREECHPALGSGTLPDVDSHVDGAVVGDREGREGGGRQLHT